MYKVNANKILLGLEIMAVLALGLLLVPTMVSAEGGRNYTFGDFDNNYGYEVPDQREETNNPLPSVKSINPSSGSRDTGFVTLAVVGNGFVPSSVVRVNGDNRPTTFIDSSNLLIQVNLNESFSTEDGFFITVWNRAPGGGYSNAKFFEVEGAKQSGNNNSGSNYGNGLSNDNNRDNSGTLNKKDTSLASSVILGNNSFLPSSLVQWTLVAIIILFIIVLARKVFGTKEEYDNTPLKHA